MDVYLIDAPYYILAEGECIGDVFAVVFDFYLENEGVAPDCVFRFVIVAPYECATDGVVAGSVSGMEKIWSYFLYVGEGKFCEV